MNKTKVKRIGIPTAIAIVLQMMAPLFLGVTAEAAPQFENAFVRLDRHKELLDTGGTVCATPLFAGTEAFVDVTFPTLGTGTDFVVDGDASHWDVTTSNLPDGADPWPGINTATTVTSKTVRFPSSDLTVGELYCFNFVAGDPLDVANTRTLVNSSVGYVFDTALQANITTYQSNGTSDIERTNWSTSVISNDQITISATVPPLFQISFPSGNTDTFGNLSPSQIINTTGVPFKIITNAKSGWIAWVKDSEQGLYSTTANYTIPTTDNTSTPSAPSSLVIGTEGYVLDADINGGAVIGDGVELCGSEDGVTPSVNDTLAIDAEYDGDQGAGTPTHGGTLFSEFQPVASCTGTAPSSSDGDIVMLRAFATIRGGTPAATDYSDIITVVGAGNF